ncbi:hypothetical protein PPL_06215 [Heterostelium album PN500]|uniref:RBR-type E3 ubiquitin transferase n=1 Tax=Heterostelium pallidum (strain ATCC 26659 / Pp 5 / PN500) TaxID=670386 RepID=D3BCJ0_HETP5|nr:hypothetical protein PPL_06215 [Heterostelium album PN500]EFA80632.1 hypothetical protein PPL_06215 [Heterostelium album PN500]|eukprot:XP_020432752.1 hypothetical protein PPL_06215 [Heterostelium album PN500]
MTVDCPICLCDIDNQDYHQLSRCKHEFCRECLQKYIVNSIQEKKYPLKCPCLKCDIEIGTTDLEILVDLSIAETFYDYAKEKAIDKDNNSFYCLTPDCKGIYFRVEGDPFTFDCEICNMQYCLKCKDIDHGEMTCEQWRIESGQVCDSLFQDYANSQKFKKCPSCTNWVEKIDGCNHIHCICDHKFCYNCGNSYPCTCGQDPHVVQEQIPEEI